MRVVAGSDWVMDIGPGAGEEGGRIICAGPPEEVAGCRESRTAPYLARFLQDPEVSNESNRLAHA
jgi:excinuclease ABC subunit A